MEAPAIDVQSVLANMHRVTRRLGTAVLAGCLLATAGCGDPNVQVWVRNDSSEEIAVAFVPSTLDGKPRTSRIVAPGTEGLAVSFTGTARGAVVIYRAAGCEELEAIDVSDTAELTISPDLDVVVREDVDLSQLTGVELDWTDRCVSDR